MTIHYTHDASGLPPSTTPLPRSVTSQIAPRRRGLARERAAAAAREQLARTAPRRAKVRARGARGRRRGGRRAARARARSRGPLQLAEPRRMEMAQSLCRRQPSESKLWWKGGEPERSATSAAGRRAARARRGAARGYDRAVRHRRRARGKCSGRDDAAREGVCGIFTRT